MIDAEIGRLRRLRDHALRSRAIARALSRTRPNPDPLLERAACTSWRVARAVAGRLMAHPYPRYQRGPSVTSLFKHAVRSHVETLRRRSRAAALRTADFELRRLGRQIDDVRALTWAPDLSETLGRSQWEIESVRAAIGHQLASGQPELQPARERVIEAGGADAADLTPELGGDWPYLAF